MSETDLGGAASPRTERSIRRAEAKVRRALPERTATVTSKSLAHAIQTVRGEPRWARLPTRYLTERILDLAAQEVPAPEGLDIDRLATALLRWSGATPLSPTFTVTASPNEMARGIAAHYARSEPEATR